MARPVPPDTIPTAVLLFCERKGTSVSRLAEDMGHSNNWITGMFRQGCPYLRPYGSMADKAGITLQSLVDAIKEKRSRELVEFLLLKFKSKGVKNRAELSRLLGVSQPFLAELCKNNGRLKGLKGYLELAEVVGVPIDDLRSETKSRAFSA